MNRKLRISFSVLTILLSFVLMGSKPYQDMGHEHDHEHELEASLTGSAEVPTPGDLDGKGKAKIKLIMDGFQVCWEIKVKGITLPATAAHIHAAVAGIPGSVVVPLSAPDGKGKAQGCRTVTHELLMNLHMHPEQYYVNVHNSDFPAGALRGQLTVEDD